MRGTSEGEATLIDPILAPVSIEVPPHSHRSVHYIPTAKEVRSESISISRPDMVRQQVCKATERRDMSSKVTVVVQTDMTVREVSN